MRTVPSHFFISYNLFTTSQAALLFTISWPCMLVRTADKCSLHDVHNDEDKIHCMDLLLNKSTPNALCAWKNVCLCNNHGAFLFPLLEMFSLSFSQTFLQQF